jgi:hypothetical protein
MGLAAVVFIPKRQDLKDEPAISVSWSFLEAVVKRLQRISLIAGDHS